MALRIYDVRNDQHRDVTQFDIDSQLLVANAYGQIRQVIAHIHEDLQSKLTDLRQRHQVAQQVDQAMAEPDAPTQG